MVETFVQDIPGLSSGENRFRKTEYDYELLKGQVEHISYQEGKRDENVSIIPCLQNIDG